LVLRLVHRAFHALHARKHVGERAEAAHALHLLDLHAKVVEVELALGHLGRELFRVLDLDRFGGRSTRLTTSPMPRIRPAIRSGWKASSASSPSPTPANLIGLPVTARIDSAAPPRASPSMRVRTTPVRSTSPAKSPWRR
jgi:hypothetical protein